MGPWSHRIIRIEPEEPESKEELETYGTKDVWVKFYVDCDVLDVMTGPDWDNENTYNDEEAEKIVDEFLKGK